MHLAEYLGLRTVPAAGVVLALTGRCPLRCAHCSTDSTAAGRDLPAGQLLRFAETFAGAAPAVALLTGGEPLLRPRLVRELADRCRAAGTATFLLTGMFYARAATVPAPVAAAVEAVDHLSASLDAFHEREVPRREVFAALHRLLAAGKDVSLHLVGSGPDDPYPDEAAAAVRREFGDRVPMLVGRLAAVGRGRSLGLPAEPATEPGAGRPLPCAMAAWPVVGVDGTVTACCNQHVLDRRPVPPHLLLGHAARDGWPAVRARTVGSPALRAVRTLGPAAMAPGRPGSPCTVCRSLRSAPDPYVTAATAALEAPVADLQTRAGPTAFARRYGSPRHADLILLGTPPTTTGRPPCES